MIFQNMAYAYIKCSDFAKELKVKHIFRPVDFCWTLMKVGFPVSDKSVNKQCEHKQFCTRIVHTLSVSNV